MEKGACRWAGEGKGACRSGPLGKGKWQCEGSPRLVPDALTISLHCSSKHSSATSSEHLRPAGGTPTAPRTRRAGSKHKWWG